MKICCDCKEEKQVDGYFANKSSKDKLDIRCKDCRKAKNAEQYKKHAEKRKAAQREYNAGHKEEISEANRKRREKDPENNKIRAKAWREAGGKTKRGEEYKKRQAEKQKERYHSDPATRERQKANARERYKRNPEKYRAKAKTYRENRLPEAQKYAREWAANVRANDPIKHQKQLDAQTLCRLKKWDRDAKSKGFVKEVSSKPLDTQGLRYLYAWQQGFCYFCNRTIGRRGVLMRTIEHILPRERGGANAKQNLVHTCQNCNSSRQEKILHLEWQPNFSMAWVEDRFFLKAVTVGGALTEAGIEWSRDKDGYWILRGKDGRERRLFIMSTFFCSDRNPASKNGKIAKWVQEQYDKPIILLDKEWFERREACLNMIRSKLGISFRSPGARQLEVIDISQETADVFLDSHHVMGRKQGAKFRLGLTDGNVLYGVGIFTDKVWNWECDRLCFHGHVPGGMSKIMKAVQDKYGNRPIRSFVDTRYADGSGHESIGFKMIGMSPETYYWVFPDRIQHQRYLSNPDKMASNLMYYNPEYKKHDNILANGIYKIWIPKKHIMMYERA